MFLDLQVGNLIEPLTGRKWDKQKIMRLFCHRIAYFQSHGMKSMDRSFIHYGNNLEFFVDLIAIWSIGGCVIPIDSRLTPFEVEVLAKTAKPRFSIWTLHALASAFFVFLMLPGELTAVRSM